jgi:hypothetical protein
MRPVLLSLVLTTPALANDAATLSARIDERIAAGWVKAKVEPAPPAEDAEFFRRLSLDLTGRIPSVANVRDFLDDDRPDKRRLWADELLDGPDFADRSAAHFANYWRAVFLAQANPQLAISRGRLEDWLRKKLRANTPYDRLVRELFTDPSAGDYFLAYEGKAENVAGSTARTFLGIRLECAQCHADRSGGTWTQEQFWQYAAFFSRMPGPRIDGNRATLNAEVSDAPPRIKVAETEKFVTARYLDGSTLDWKAGADPRAVLADWLTRPDNQWFARAAVNRVWHGLFGVGLIDPVDGLGAAENAPSHPELLDELARAFIEQRFDVKFLIRAIVGTKAYQRTSRQTHPSQADPRLFARMPTRGLSAEQLFDSLVEATGYTPPAENTGRYGIGPATSPRATFLARFQTHPDQPIDTATSIQQALNLMNGSLAASAMSADGSRTLRAVADGRGSPGEQVGQLFLAVLSRQPTEAEQQRLVGYVKAAKDRKAALADVFWVLLNSTEFAVNH